MEKYDYSDIGEFINIGAGEDIRIKDLAEMIKSIIGFKGKFIHDTSKPDGMHKKLLDVSRMNYLGWNPKTTLRDGIRKSYEYYVASGSGQA